MQSAGVVRFSGVSLRGEEGGGVGGGGGREG